MVSKQQHSYSIYLLHHRGTRLRKEHGCCTSMCMVLAQSLFPACYWLMHHPTLAGRKWDIMHAMFAAVHLWVSAVIVSRMLVCIINFLWIGCLVYFASMEWSLLSLIPSPSLRCTHCKVSGNTVPNFRALRSTIWFVHWPIILWLADHIKVLSFNTHQTLITDLFITLPISRSNFKGRLQWNSTSTLHSLYMCNYVPYVLYRGSENGTSPCLASFPGPAQKSGKGPGSTSMSPM